MKKNILILLLSLNFSFAFAQSVGINTDGSTPDPSAILDIKSDSRGVLVPRLTTNQRTMINTPANGLLVFDTDTESFWFFANSNWQDLSTPIQIADADRDTKIQVEKAADEDMIRFDVKGTETWKMIDARLEPSNSGLSTFIGINAGFNDDLQSRQNVYIGYQTGLNNLSGAGNVAVGNEALKNSLFSYGNVAIGQLSFKNLTSGVNNTGLGRFSGFYNITGESNVYIGNNTARGIANYNSTSNNVIIGKTAGYFISSNNSNNVLLGTNSGHNLSGTGNIFLGYRSGFNETSSNKLYIENSDNANPLLYGEFDNDLLRINGSLNINNAFTFPITDGTTDQVLRTDGAGNITWAPVVEVDGDPTNELQTLSITGDQLSISSSNTISIPNSGASDIIVDADADTKIQVEENADEDMIRFDVAGTEQWKMVGPRLENQNSGHSIYIGEDAGLNDDLSSTLFNIGIGRKALFTNTTGHSNIAIGDQTLEGNITGFRNVAIGGINLFKNTTGYENTAIGQAVMAENTTGNSNNAIGYNALLSNVTGSSNSAFGNYAMWLNVSGFSNSAFGRSALGSANGSNNTAVGAWAMLSHISGTSNTAMGVSVLRNNISGSANIALGGKAGYNQTSGDNNVYIGDNSGNGNIAHVKSGNVFIGYQSGYFETGSNKLYIENSDNANPLLYGEFDNDLLRINGSLNINNAFTFPTVDGTSDQILKTDGAGNVTWSPVVEVDGDPTNELQTLSKVGNTFTLSHGGGSFLDEINDDDADETNELQTISKSGNIVTLSNSGGSFIDEIDDADSDASNELQTIAIFGDQLSISSGNTITIPSSSSGGATDMIQDADADTKIQVEESTDQDIIRFDIAGTEHWRMVGTRLESVNTGQSTYIGQDAGLNDDASNNLSNIGIGRLALQSTITGGNNIAIGVQALKLNTTNNNVAIGSSALNQNTTGGSNTAVGAFVMMQNTTGSSNNAIGYNALNLNTSGSNNSAFGNFALSQSNADKNTAFGRSALANTTTGGTNTALGSFALVSNTIGGSNVAIGNDVMRLNTQGSLNVSIGAYAGYYQTDGDRNVLIGRGAGQGSSTHNKSGNIFIGYESGKNETESNKLYIENSDNVNPLLYGEFDNDLLRINGSLNINNAFTFPTTDGTVGQVLKTDGSGVVSWQASTGSDNLGNHMATQGLDMGNNVIENLSDPTTPQEAATKNYVDTNDDVNDADANPINELQTLSISSNQLTISTGNTVTLPSGGGGSGDSISDADGDTKIQVEETADEDIIRFDIAGTEAIVIEEINSSSNTPRLSFGGTSNNVVIGKDAGGLGGFNNVAIGSGAMNLAISGNHNTAIGMGALLAVQNGATNTAVGFGALQSGGGIGGNTAVGYLALTAAGNNGHFNTAMGNNTLENTGQGGSNCAFGYHSLRSNIDGNINCAFGSGTLYSNDYGFSNTAIGQESMYENTNGDFNTAIGRESLKDNVTGNSRSALGAYANETGTGYSNNTAIGANTNCSASNQVRIGNAVGSIGGPANWSNTSDSRFKINIKENVKGLAFIQKLRPVTYQLNQQAVEDFFIEKHNKSNRKIWDGTSEFEKMIRTGFIAQEVEEAAQSLNYDFSGVDQPKNDKDFYGLRYAEFTVPLVKAVQELAEEVDQQKNMITELQTQNQKLLRVLIELQKENNTAKSPNVLPNQK